MRFLCHVISYRILWFISFSLLLFRNSLIYPHVTGARGPSKPIYRFRVNINCKCTQVNTNLYRRVGGGTAIPALSPWCLLVGVFLPVLGLGYLRSKYRDKWLWFNYVVPEICYITVTLAHISHARIIFRTILCSSHISSSAYLGLAGHYLIVPLYINGICMDFSPIIVLYIIQVKIDIMTTSFQAFVLIRKK